MQGYGLTLHPSPESADTSVLWHCCVRMVQLCGQGMGVQMHNTPNTVLEGAFCIHDWHRQPSPRGRDAMEKRSLQDLKGSCGYSLRCLTQSKTIKSKKKKSNSYFHECLQIGLPEN